MPKMIQLKKDMLSLFNAIVALKLPWDALTTLHRTLTVSQQDQLGEFEPELCEQREVEVPQAPAAGVLLQG